MSWVWKSPVGGSSGICLPLDWYKEHPLAASPFVEQQICPDLLLIAALYGSATIRPMVNFAGRGWVGIGACGSDAYVSALTFPDTYDTSTSDDPNSIAQVDVWGAYRDGVWTSSTTILVSMYSSPATGTTVFGQARNNEANRVTKAITTQNTAFCPGGGAVLQATITVNDDGTISIA